MLSLTDSSWAPLPLSAPLRHVAGPPRIAIDARTESLTYLDESFAPGDKVRCFIVALRNGGGRHHAASAGTFPPSLLPPGVATRNGFHHASSLMLLPVNKHGKISCQFTGVVKRVSFKATCVRCSRCMCSIFFEFSSSNCDSFSYFVLC